jgi:hypothetical protein
LFDEESRRAPHFDPDNSVGIFLADEQEWFLPKPWVVIRPQFVDGVATTSYRFFSYTAKLDILVDAIAAAEDLDQVVVGAATLAAYLLRYHYDLSDADLDTLLSYRVGEPDSIAWTMAVIEVATGQSGKKVGRAGGD